MAENDAQSSQAMAPGTGGMQQNMSGGGGLGQGLMGKVQQMVKVRTAILERGMMTMQKAGQNHTQALQMTSQAQHFGGKGRLLNATFDADSFSKQQLADKLPELFGPDSSDNTVYKHLSDSKNIGKAHSILSDVLGTSKANDVMQQVARSQEGKKVAGKMGDVSKANTAKNLKRGNLGDAAQFDHMTWMNGK